jgi:hypothetical protein
MKLRQKTSATAPYAAEIVGQMTTLGLEMLRRLLREVEKVDEIKGRSRASSPTRPEPSSAPDRCTYRPGCSLAASPESSPTSPASPTLESRSGSPFQTHGSLGVERNRYPRVFLCLLSWAVNQQCRGGAFTKRRLGWISLLWNR